MASHSPALRRRVCAVSYLNTVPLVWGMLRGPQQGLFDLDFQIPATCADLLQAGAAEIGLVPAIELARQDLQVIPGAGIACRGAVRSILVVSSCPPEAIRTLAADASSRTSVELARLVLERRYGAHPEIRPHPPDLDAMLGVADAALLIGDSALRVDPRELGLPVLDLGAEWMEMTGLPMVFAVWAGRKGCPTEAVAGAFLDSCRFGRAHLEEIVAEESAARGFSPELVREYLGRHIVHELGPAEYRGMELFLKLAAASTLGAGHASK